MSVEDSPQGEATSTPSGSSAAPPPTHAEFAALQSRVIDMLELMVRGGRANNEDGSFSKLAEDFKPPPFASKSTPESKSLRSHFPSIKATTLLEIVRHSFEADDIHKLDHQDRPSFDSKAKLPPGLPQQIKGPYDLIVPLLTYFQVLQTHAASSGASALDVAQIANGGMTYISNLIEFSTRYQWSAVLRYHTRFHDVRRAAMSAGDYSGWDGIDTLLLGQTLAGREKSMEKKSSLSSDGGSGSAKSKPKSQQFCFAFNKGTCSSPCEDGRMHKCRKCESPDHPEKSCPKSKT
jgi:hypothetical protein